MNAKGITVDHTKGFDYSKFQYEFKIKDIWYITARDGNLIVGIKNGEARDKHIFKENCFVLFQETTFAIR